MLDIDWVIIVSTSFLQSQLFHFLDSFRCRGQILVTVSGDVNIIFDAYSTDPPIAFQYLGIDVLFEFRRVDERFDDKSAEINLFG